jgi:hypothetical protein
MPILPNADKAIVPGEKLRDYSLNSSHDRGKHKARVFASALGMTPADAARLRDMILQAALTNEAVETETNRHGTRYTLDFQTLGANGAVTIRTACDY